MLEYGEFKETLKEEVQKEVEGILYFTVMVKNNHEEKEALSIKTDEHNCVPVIHLKELYEKYQDGGTMDECAEYVKGILETKKEIGMEEVWGTWEEAKSRIRLQVINRKWNEERLKDLPHQEYLNLAIIARIHIYKEDMEGSAVVTSEMLNYWEISEKELFHIGFCNLKETEFIIEDLEEVVLRAFGFSEESNENEKASGIQYVMHNEAMINGATGLLRIDLLEEFANEQECDIWILPSSIHELILVPDRGGLDLQMLRDMVKDINDTEVAQEERLADDVYKFYRESKTVELVE